SARLRALRRVPEEPQRGQRQVARFGPGAPAALDPDRVSRQGEADGGDAARAGARPAVRDEAVLPVYSLPEPTKRPLLNLAVEGRQIARRASQRLRPGGQRSSGKEQTRSRKKSAAV